MKSLVFIQPLRKGALSSYKNFIKELTRKKKEYKDLLLRYDLHTAKFWHRKLGEIDYIFVLHDAGSHAMEKVKGWATSKDPFDLWVKEQLSLHFETTLEEPDLLFDLDTK